MRHIPGAILVFLILATLTSGVRADEAAVNLQPRFVTGRTTRYQIWTQRQRSMTGLVGGQTRRIETHFEIEGRITWTIQRVNPDGSASAVMTMDYLTVNITLPDGAIKRNDSRQGSGDTAPVHTLIRAMCGAPMTLTVAPDGSVANVTGTDVIRSRAGDDIDVPEDLDFIETASDLATIPFAPAAAAVGKAWPTRFDWLHELGQLHYQTTSKLDGMETIAGIPVAVVSSTSQVDLTVDRSKLPEGAPVQVRLLSGSARGKVMFDTTRAEAVGRNSVLSTQIESRMDIAGQTITQITDETIQSQTLRISEE
ncbi:MAG: hypothetical protein IT440_09815 [Phycisphaeraceae bacterium]|nr:hypothetical protein [Phycisphaeraceae bacterium]